MIKRFLTLWLSISGLLAGSVAMHAADAPPANSVAATTNSVFKDEFERAGYAWGLLNGGNLKRNEVEFDLDQMNKGLKDGLSGAAPLMTETEAKDALNKYGDVLKARKEAKLKVLGEKNLKEADAFLAQNKTKPGVITLPSGLQYQALNEGNGTNPVGNDTVELSFRITLIDDTEIDSSSKRTAPVKVRPDAANLPKGVAEALLLMKQGSKWRLFLSPALAGTEHIATSTPYGPNVALVYELEIVKIEPLRAAEAPAQQPLVSDTIRVPSAEEMKKGEKITTIKAEDLQKEIEKEKAKAAAAATAPAK